MTQPPSNPPAGQETSCTQSGPCSMCGDTNYPLSYGGPMICPACDCGVNPKVSRLKRELAAAKAQLATAREDMKEECAKVCDREARFADHNELEYNNKLAAERAGAYRWAAKAIRALKP